MLLLTLPEGIDPMDEFFDSLLILLVGSALVWFIYKRVKPGDGPGHAPWGNWNTTYNAPPVYPVKVPVYLYPFYKGAEIVE